eukprot:TRINITY_DN1918_c0_g1_i1.p1 TRINITY_DN1918_c0_g1~~TRINITY_DN1918_c0_g1_i1.p1  ORF type:complete len:205 (+),score=36.43 TRINITY_DN1918_c0_g1_i1:51-665(+)
MKQLLVLLSFFVIAVLSQTPISPTSSPNPTIPKWPYYFSASVVAHSNNREEPPRFARWFYDSVKNKDRLDSISEWHSELYWTERIFDHSIQREYMIFFQQGSVSCYYRSINTTLPKPNFSNFVYIGRALIDEVPVYHWIDNDRTNGITIQYYEDIKYREPKRIDLANDRERRSETWIFYEFDTCSQDPELFDVPAFIRSSCNPL